MSGARSALCTCTSHSGNEAKDTSGRESHWAVTTNSDNAATPNEHLLRRGRATAAPPAPRTSDSPHRGQWRRSVTQRILPCRPQRRPARGTPPPLARHRWARPSRPPLPRPRASAEPRSPPPHHRKAPTETAPLPTSFTPGSGPLGAPHTLADRPSPGRYLRSGRRRRRLRLFCLSDVKMAARSGAGPPPPRPQAPPLHRARLTLLARPALPRADWTAAGGAVARGAGVRGAAGRRGLGPPSSSRPLPPPAGPPYSWALTNERWLLGA